jgi:CHAT domain-containing protein
VSAVLAMAGAVAGTTVQPSAAPFEHCSATGASWSYQDLLCIYQTAMQRGLRAAARARLRELGGGDPTHPWPTLVLAHATLDDDATTAISLYEAAASGFAGEHEAEGEVIARQNLRILYQRRGAHAAAAQQVELAVAAAEASALPLTIARASVLQAGHLTESGGDVGAARLALLRAERHAFPDGPISLRRAILFALANAQLYLGHLGDAIDTLERHQALRGEDGSDASAAAVAFNLLNARVWLAEARPTSSARTALVPLATAVVDEAARLSRPYVEAQAHRLLAELVKPEDPVRAAGHLDRCLQLAAPSGYPDVRASCLWSRSWLEAARQPRLAEQLSQQAIGLTARHRSSPLLAHAWLSRMRLVWSTAPASQAVSESMQALDAVERLRAAQRSDTARAGLFSSWTRDYYWLAGRLLANEPPLIDRAFEVGERLRARVLLEQVEQANVADGSAPGVALPPDEAPRRIADAQRRLLVPSLAPAERDSLLSQLRLLEVERDEFVGGQRPRAEATPMPFATIAAVQRAAGHREAILWYSIAPWTDLYGEFGGGAWVLAVTRDRASLHRLPTRPELDMQVAALTGLLQRRDASASTWTAAARRLGDTLLAEALETLPPSIEQLTIVTDDVLHRLPFEALSTTERTRWLGERFDIAVVPSATLLLRLRDAESPRFANPALVFADPEVRSGNPAGQPGLAPLPWARREADAIARSLQLPDAAVLGGAAATEERLKAATRGSYAVLHLAAHARADGSFPERSAVFLAASGAADDGWLQPREIAGLALDGATVVLSACESAAGPVISGEGPLSLARAFFAAGATSVVATRWPLRDDDAEFLMDRLYRALARGTTVGGALRRARQEAMAAGLPAAAWAGVALLGDGARVPISPIAEARSPWAVLAALGVALLAVLWWAIRRATASFDHA